MKTVAPLAVLNAAKCIELYGQSAVMMVTAPDGLCVYEVPAARVLAEWVLENCGAEEDVEGEAAEAQWKNQAPLIRELAYPPRLDDLVEAPDDLPSGALLTYRGAPVGLTPRAVRKGEEFFLMTNNLGGGV